MSPRILRTLPFWGGLVFLIALSTPRSAGSQQSFDLLLLGSTHSFSEAGESGVEHEPAFDPRAIADELRKILQADPQISGTVEVAFEDLYRSKTVSTALGQSGERYDFEYRCFSLAQYVMWPEGRDGRLARLRGEGGRSWDHVVILGDPYLLANMPGIYAEGVKLVVDEVAKGSAEPLLLMQWPAEGSRFGVDHLAEVTYRVGAGAGIPVVPAGLAWARWSSRDAAPEHPTPDGAYLAAASLYSQIFARSASGSSYAYDDALADHALDTLQALADRPPDAGRFTFDSPFAMRDVKQRHVDYNHTGTSSENGIMGGLDAALDRSMMTHARYEAPPWPEGVAPVDFNYGRGNSWFEPGKRYQLDPALYELSFGFPMQDQKGSAAVSMRYGIDKRYGYEDGTDLGIAYDMIREGELAMGARAIPIRLMWAKIRDARPELTPLRDGWHMSRVLDEASGSYMVTLLTGRTPVDEAPADQDSEAWNRWLGRRIGYETAWRMATLQARAPGLRVLPSSTKAEETTAFTLSFLFPPQQEVTVDVRVDQPAALGVDPKRLRFGPEDHGQPQTVTVTGYLGADPDRDYGVSFETSSQDSAYDGLDDRWTVRIVDPRVPAPTVPPTATAGPTRPSPETPTATAPPSDGSDRLWLPVLGRAR